MNEYKLPIETLSLSLSPQKCKCLPCSLKPIVTK